MFAFYLTVSNKYICHKSQCQFYADKGTNSRYKRAYNQRGELTEKIDTEGYLTRYGYTMYDKLNYMKYGDGREVRLTYNSLRQLEEIND